MHHVGNKRRLTYQRTITLSSLPFLTFSKISLYVLFFLSIFPILLQDIDGFGFNLVPCLASNSLKKERKNSGSVLSFLGAP